MWRGLIILTDDDAVTGTLITFERTRERATPSRETVRGEPCGPGDYVLAAAGDLCHRPTQPLP